jgi:hypothetical protein
MEFRAIRATGPAIFAEAAAGAAFSVRGYWTLANGREFR